MKLSAGLANLVRLSLEIAFIEIFILNIAKVYYSQVATLKKKKLTLP
jgi:hypothetical protein